MNLKRKIFLWLYTLIWNLKLGNHQMVRWTRNLQNYMPYCTRLALSSRQLTTWCCSRASRGKICHKGMLTESAQYVQRMRNVSYVLHTSNVGATVTGTGNQSRMKSGADQHSYKVLHLIKWLSWVPAPEGTSWEGTFVTPSVPFLTKHNTHASTWKHMM